MLKWLETTLFRTTSNFVHFYTLIYLGSQKNSANLYFEKSRPHSTESFTGYVSMLVWMTIMSKLETFEN